MDPTGAYTADRAAALSGVPKSTVHWWARHGILVPSVSATRVRLWSYADLIGLRTIYWLRQRKTSDIGVDIPPTSMSAVRRALLTLRAVELPLWRDGKPSVFVDAEGEVYVEAGEGPQTPDGQHVLEVIDLIAPFTTVEGLRGPHLVQPRPLLRILPGKLGGSPHVDHTRLETRTIAALKTDGFTPRAIRDLYPYLTPEQVEQALDLEDQLAQNLRAA